MPEAVGLGEACVRPVSRRSCLFRSACPVEIYSGDSSLRSEHPEPRNRLEMESDPPAQSPLTCGLREGSTTSVPFPVLPDIQTVPGSYRKQGGGAEWTQHLLCGCWNQRAFLEASDISAPVPLSNFSPQFLYLSIRSKAPLPSPKVPALTMGNALKLKASYTHKQL